MIVELYAGAGGISEGIRTLNLGPAVGIELGRDACRTATAAGHLRIRADVATYPTAPLASRTVGLAGGPPCQPFSAAGQRRGEDDSDQVHELVDAYAAGSDRAWLDMAWADDRSHHAAQPVRWVRDLRPEWVVLEQVPAVLPLWRHIAQVLRGWGYDTWTGVLCAADYGVPQKRRRAVLIASRVLRVRQPWPTHYDARRGEQLLGTPWVSMAEALGWTGVDRPARTVCGDRSPRWAYGQGEGSYATGWTLHTNRGQEPDGSRQEVDPYVVPAPTLTGKSGGQWTIAWRNGNRERSAIREPDEPDEPAPTIHFGNNHNKVEWVTTRPATTIAADPRVPAPGHRDRAGGERQHADSIKVTVHEAAILQGFRPDFPWQGTKTSQFGQVGNAMPPPLAAAAISVAAGIDALLTRQAAHAEAVAARSTP